jgi:Na+-transporting methylmalonyl-CoA/oxaloacetate decarboxylase beta subunit
MDVLSTIWSTLTSYLADSGFGHLHWSNVVMLLVGGLFIYLAIRKKYEPLLLLPIGFGMLIGNIPYDAGKLPLGVYDGPVSEADLAYYACRVSGAELAGGVVFEPPSSEWAWPAAESIALRRGLGHAVEAVYASGVERIEEPSRAMTLLYEGDAVVVNMHRELAPRVDINGPGIYSAGGGRYVFVADPSSGPRYPELWSLAKQDPHNASVFWWLFAGVGLAGFYPPLIFLGIGAMTDFGSDAQQPEDAAARRGGAVRHLREPDRGGVPGVRSRRGGVDRHHRGADGPTAIFTCSRLAPELLGAVALAAYSYMAMVPIIQPPIVKLLTTKAERRIRMSARAPVSGRVRVVFPIVGFLLTALLAPGGLPLLGMLFLGNLLRESMVTERLAHTARTAFVDIVTILLGVTVGAKTSAESFLTVQTVSIFLLGLGAFAVATATGVLFAKAMNRLSRDQVNPMIGAAGVSAVPMSARVVHRMGLEEDPQNFLLMHAMGPNVAGVIGSAVAAGVLLSRLAGG